MNGTSCLSTVSLLPFDEQYCVQVMKCLDIDRKAAKTFCDGTLRAETKEYPVHKCIVGAVSEYFKKLFTTEMREKYEEVVKVSKITDDLLGKVLDFVYSGYVELREDCVCEFLDGADYMQLDSLKSRCEKYMLETLSAESCLKYQDVAQRFNLDEVCETAKQFACDNFSEVVRHKRFRELDKDAIFAMLTAVKGKVSEETVFTSISLWVNHNKENRQEFFEIMFSSVDLSLLSEQFLNQQVVTEPLVFTSLSCMQRFFDPEASIKLHAKRNMETSEADRFVVCCVGVDGKNCVAYYAYGKRLMQFPSLCSSRYAGAAAMIGDGLIIAGGGNRANAPSSSRSAEFINLRDPNKWALIASMCQHRRFAAAGVLNGNMVVTGGWSDGSYLSSCEIYNSELNQWSDFCPLLYARSGHAAVSTNNRLYCLGGRNERALSSVECYNPLRHSWQEIKPMQTARRQVGAVALDGYIYAIGGKTDDNSDLNTVEKYHPDKNEWTSCGRLNVGRSGPGVCEMNGKIYAVGGRSGGLTLSTVEVYDQNKDEWHICFSMQLSSYCNPAIAF